MEKKSFEHNLLQVINNISNSNKTLEEASDISKIDFTKFNFQESSVVETGGYIPYGKGMDSSGHYLTMNEFAKKWESMI